MRLPLSTRKAIRKWCDRGYFWREALLDRVRFGATGKRVLLWPWEKLEPEVQSSFRYTRHRAVFAPIPPGGGDNDVVVPLSVETLLAAAADPELCRRNPLPIPTAEAIQLFDDKAACNERLRRLGYGRHVPADAQPGAHPYFLKLRRDAFAQNIHLINGPADEELHRERIASADYLRQTCVDGVIEYSAHVLHWGGKTRRALSMKFEMHHERAIKGRDPFYLHRRCRNRHLPLFESMLNDLGFEGICCFNYKELDGVPRIFEINPRFGFSLGAFFGTFLRSLDWSRRR